MRFHKVLRVALALVIVMAFAAMPAAYADDAMGGGRLPRADLGIALDGEVIDSQVFFTLTVSNDGPDNARKVYVGQAFLSHNLEFSSASGDCDGYWFALYCSVGDLAAGDVTEITVVADITGDGPIKSAAGVAGFVRDPNYSNNYDFIEISDSPVMLKEIPSGAIEAVDRILDTIQKLTPK